MTTTETPKDVAQTALPRVSSYDYSLFGEIEIKPLGPIRKVIAARMRASWLNIPHVAQFDEVDITELEALRQRLKPDAQRNGVKLTVLAFAIKACALALKAFPEFNSSLDDAGQNLILKKYCHIAFAVDTPVGLLVPVIKDADKKSLLEIATAIGTLTEKARTKRLAFSDMEGACFSVSNLGKLGGTGFVPVINAPEVAILGIGRSAQKPVVDLRGNIIARLMMPLSVVYDHRVIDGIAAGRFMEFLCAKFSTPEILSASSATP